MIIANADVSLKIIGNVIISTIIAKFIKLKLFKNLN